MQDVTRTQIENMSDKNLQSLLETCKEIVANRKHQKMHDQHQIFCDLYDDAWIKLKFKFEDDVNYESKYTLVHIDKVQDVCCAGDDDVSKRVIVKTTYFEQYHLDTLNKDDVEIRHIKANSDTTAINCITFDTTEVFEFVKPELVGKIVETAIDKLKA